ncbi:type IV pilus modification PilV family protein [Cystobacter fuscus]
MLRRGSFRPRHGFTTIEALVAAVVFLLGLSGLLGALTQARNATGQARRYMQATDIANDLVEQMQLWNINDPRLSSSTGVCNDDPLDKAGAMLQPKESSAYKTYVGCMKSEANLRSGKWAGLMEPNPATPFDEGYIFTDEQGNTTRYWRYFMVRRQEVRLGVTRLQIWVKVRYDDAGEPRVVTTQAMRVQMGS